MSCVSNVDALGASTAASVVFAINGWERLSDHRHGITPLERAQRTWLRNRSFMHSLGLDPIAVLGPPPGTDSAVPTTPGVTLVSRPASTRADTLAV